MNELSININIAGRVYPITVTPGEEADLRSAGKLIQDKLQLYSEQFALRDNQDALAMFALEIANELQKTKNRGNLADAEIEKELNQTVQLLTPIQL
ncbi:MAG: cell division protein ZapA [Bacteroidia bacterium]|nr:cell division protein ZapA [Bacteroidia bacterium]